MVTPSQSYPARLSIGYTKQEHADGTGTSTVTGSFSRRLWGGASFHVFLPGS